MARDSVGVLYLQRIVVGVGFQTLVAFGLGAHIGVVCHHLVEKLLTLFACERWRLGGERVGECRHLQLVVVVVGELQPEVDEVEAVEVAAVAHALYHGTVAVGYERRCRRVFSLLLLGPVVAVLHHHEPVARCEFLLAPKHLVAYTLIVYVCTLVGARNNHRLVHAHLRIARSERLDEFVAGHAYDVGEAAEANLGQGGRLVVRNHLAYHRGVVEYARLLALAQHLAQVAFVDSESVAGDER